MAACNSARDLRAERERAVYAAVIDNDFSPDGARLIVLDPAVMVPTLSAFGPPVPSNVDPERHALEELGVPPAMAADFVVANDGPDSLQLPIPARLPVLLDTLSPLTRHQLDSLRRSVAGQAIIGAGFERYERAYPGTRYLIRLSRVGFSPDGKQAVAFAAVYCGELCSSVFLFRLRQESGRWLVAEKLVLGSS
jgi:hypothetical protein